LQGFSGFLITLARSRSLDRLRSQKSRQEKLQRIQTLADSVSEYNHPLEVVITQERADRVQAALQQLAPADRQLLETAYYQGLSQSKIAQPDDLPLGTVKSRTRRALRQLRDLLDHLV
jgi:RNA polymerase sigma-70 factor, ECF subfamily